MANPENVILLHGLARSASSMKRMEQCLIAQGYAVINVDYPSRHYPIEVLAEKVIPQALQQCGDGEISFVTHSMGGILVRQYLSKHKIARLNKVVMLGPPNKGSEVVDKLGKFPGFHLLNGDAGMQLGTGKLSVPNQLGQADFNLGIIAGTQSINWLLSLLIPGKNDGKVSVERTRLEGMKEHLEMNTTHPFMMKNDKVIEQVIYYLQTGKFRTYQLKK
ncbi:alpha/beta fold hydrolase [Thalassomonas sp. RHCl1]|uniref:esterase/lipase family protein n=1 Tax=Thalassomonas sp. RHCl1 TaxID=2995320 RepID=UPI00248C9535|nr:alpha/beta fold hydrolase [Thalassomonas sp. RHCl1]